MTQCQFNRAVAKVTGESVGTIGHMGFSVAGPNDGHYRPEPCDYDIGLETKILD